MRGAGYDRGFGFPLIPACPCQRRGAFCRLLRAAADTVNRPRTWCACRCEHRSFSAAKGAGFVVALTHRSFPISHHKLRTDRRHENADVSCRHRAYSRSPASCRSPERRTCVVHCRGAWSSTRRMDVRGHVGLAHWVSRGLGLRLSSESCAQLLDMLAHRKRQSPPCKFQMPDNLAVM